MAQRSLFLLMLGTLLLNGCGSEPKSDKNIAHRHYSLSHLVAQTIRLFLVDNNTLTCEDGYHNTDGDPSNGCECREERAGSDVPKHCAGAVKETLGDRCSSHQHEKIFEGTLHNKDDIDLYFVKLIDAGSLFCDIKGDTFRGRVELLSGPPGLLLCVRPKKRNSGCVDTDLVFNDLECGRRKYLFDGSRMVNDSLDLTTWPMWHPRANPQCAEYKLLISANSI